MSENPVCVYACCHRAADFVLKLWPDGAVIYDEADGNLQVLSPVAAQAFGHLLAQRCMSPRALAQLLLDDEPTADEEAMVNRLLLEFESTGLLECVLVC